MTSEADANHQSWVKKQAIAKRQLQTERGHIEPVPKTKAQMTSEADANHQEWVRKQQVVKQRLAQERASGK